MTALALLADVPLLNNPKNAWRNLLMSDLTYSIEMLAGDGERVALPRRQRHARYSVCARSFFGTWWHWQAAVARTLRGRRAPRGMPV